MAKLQWLAKDKKTLWQTWLNRGGRVAIALLLVMAIAVTGCGQSSDIPSRTSNPSVGSVATAPVPAEIAKLDRYMESYRPKVAIVSPRTDEVLQDTQVSVRFTVQDYPLFKDEELGLGPNLHVILDNKPYIAHYDANRPLLLTDLEPGTHTLRVFAARPWHESFKNREAYAQTTFHVFTKTEEYTPQSQLPVLTYSSPSESYGAEPILLDVWLANAPIRESLVPDVPKDWRIRYTLNGKRSTLDRWQPIYLTGLKSGRNIVSVELVDGDGQPIRNVFNSAARTIDYHPGGTDTLSKLVRGALKAEDALAIVGATPEPEPELEPEPEFSEPEAGAEPEPAPALSEEDKATEEEGPDESASEPEATEIKLEEEPAAEVEPETEVESTPEETLEEFDNQELPASPAAISAEDSDTSETSLTEDELELDITEELEDTERVSEPEFGESELLDKSEVSESQELNDTLELNTTEEPNDFEEVSEPEAETVEPLTSPSDSTESPASASNESQSWWQKLRGQFEQDNTVKLESEETSDTIPQTLVPDNTFLDEESDVTSSPSGLDENIDDTSPDNRNELDASDRPIDETLDSPKFVEPADTEPATIDEQESREKEEEVSQEVPESEAILDSDNTDASDRLSEDKPTPSETASTSEATERPLNFWQKFLRDRQPIPSEPTAAPEVPAQLTSPDVKLDEEEIELPVEEPTTLGDNRDSGTINKLGSDRSTESSAEPELDEPDALTDLEASESSSESVTPTQRPRSFLQRFQQQRQQLTPSPTPERAIESVDDSAISAEEDDMEAGTVEPPPLDTSDISEQTNTTTDLELNGVNTTTSPAEQKTDEATTNRPRFLQRFQQDRQQAPTSSSTTNLPSNLPSNPIQDEDSAPSSTMSEESEVEVEDITSEPDTPSASPNTEADRPLGFLEKLRQQKRRPPSPATIEVPSTLTGGEPSSTVESEDKPTLNSAPAELSEQQSTDLEPDLEPATDRPSGLMQRFQRRRQNTSQPLKTRSTAPTETENSTPASEKPTPSPAEPSSNRSHPFLEQLKRDRPSTTEQRPQSPAQPLSPPPSTPAETADTTESEESLSARKQSSQETLRNFIPSPGENSAQQSQITTVGKPRTPSNAGGHSLLPPSISDRPQQISIPPRL